jgi:hypothetical protein
VHHVVLRKKTPINLLSQAYCKKRTLLTAAMCMLFKGKPLSGEESVGELGMVDHDTIDVAPLTINLTSDAGGGDASSSSSEHINLQVSCEIFLEV